MGQRKKPTTSPAQNCQCCSTPQSKGGKEGSSPEGWRASWRTQTKSDEIEPLAADAARGLFSIDWLDPRTGAVTKLHGRHIYLFIVYKIELRQKSTLDKFLHGLCPNLTNNTFLSRSIQDDGQPQVAHSQHPAQRFLVHVKGFMPLEICKSKKPWIFTRIFFWGGIS